MESIKIIFILIISVILGFGFWYLIGWFLSNEPNLFLWPWYAKVLYLMFGSSTAGAIAKEIA
jgi:hypothetical protein